MVEGPTSVSRHADIPHSVGIQSHLLNARKIAAFHSASRLPTPTWTVHKSVTVECGFILVQLNKCVVVCGSVLQRGHSGASAAKKYIQRYLQKVFVWTKHNNITLNSDKTTYTLFPLDPAEYKSHLDLKINNTALPMATHPKVQGVTLDQTLTYSTHIHNISVHAHKPLQIIKAL